MREIKFRAWDNEHKEMFVPAKLEWNQQKELRYFNKYSFWNSGMVIMQFAGLKDKNGKEGYHGDIVKLNSDEYYSNNTVSFEELKDVIGVINWWDYGWVISAPDKTWCIPLGDTDNMEVEIIGNIYENKELLAQ